MKLIIFEEIPNNNDNKDNKENDIEKYFKNSDKRTLLFHLSKYKDNTKIDKDNKEDIIKRLTKAAKFHFYKLNEVINQEKFEFENTIKILEKDINEANITRDININIKKNDILMFENKRKYTNKITDEIIYFLEHSFFLSIYMIF